MKIKNKNKINYTVSAPYHPKRLTQRATSSGLHSQMALGSKTKESSNYRVYFERIFKLQGWNLNFFYRGLNRNSPKLQGVNTY